MKNLFAYLLIAMMLFSCGENEVKGDNPKKIEINYMVTDKGITTIIVPYELYSNLINGVKIDKIIKRKGVGNTIYSYIYTEEPVLLDRTKCPIINGYRFKARCVYIIRKSSLD